MVFNRKQVVRNVLIQEALDGNYPAIRELIEEKKENPSVKDEKGRCMLTLAIINGHINCANKLLNELHVNPDSRD